MIPKRLKIWLLERWFTDVSMNILSNVYIENGVTIEKLEEELEGDSIIRYKLKDGCIFTIENTNTTFINKFIDHTIKAD